MLGIRSLTAHDPLGQLPSPDAYGNYWLTRVGNKPDTTGPCVLHGGAGVPARWFASLGGDRGLLFAGPYLRYFGSPGEALEALREARG